MRLNASILLQQMNSDGSLMAAASDVRLNPVGSRMQVADFVGMTEQEINEGYRSLIALLTQVDPSVTMQIANSIWYRNGFSVLQNFLDTGRQYFDAEIQGLNFNDQVGALNTINAWVDAKTNHKIPTILDRITPNEVMFLINAMYFNATWRNKFDAADTYSAPFHAAGGLAQSASLVHRHAEMSYFESAAYQAVDLPYGNSAFTMTVILPRTTTDVETVAASLTPAEWQSLTRGLHDVEVDLSLPKLKLSYERLLNDDLKSLGMLSAFGAADFSCMSNRTLH